MKYIPHNYQSYSTEFICNNPISALFLDCGLGKSVITLTSIKALRDEEKVKKVLIVAPLRVAINTWPSEIKKWDHLAGLTYSVIVGRVKKRLKALEEPVDITIINRENLEWLICNSGIEWCWDMVVLDELSSFKSYQSKRFKAMMLVRNKIDRITGLTATPCSSSLMDLFAEMKVLDGGERLGKYITHFRNKYFDSDVYSNFIDYYPKEFAEDAIYERISDICISMRALDYLEMPDIVYNNVEVELDDKERGLYKSLKNNMFLSLEGGDIDAKSAATLSNKLLQMSNGSVYDEEKNSIHIHDRKLDALEDLIEAQNGKSVLVAYWFKSDKERILNRFKDARVISSEDGINDWNAGKISIGLIHPASCSMGLNLQEGGSTLIWFSMCWSLEMYEQTNCRLYRQGQKNTVVIHHIICKDSIDNRVLEALVDKDTTQSALIDAVKAEVRE
ncbi:MAG: DEAD/DEAH box helicase [Candidatus Enterosoma sp.]|nr:DEAD/DEAH box helicase [Candidatus Enterosoma sp.]